MNTNHVGPGRVAPSYGVQRSSEQQAARGATGSPGTPGASRPDRMTLSPEAQALLQAQRSGEEPEGRAALLEQLRRQVQDGTYRVDEYALARRIAQRLRADSADGG
jgi:flagellar biosynthesis anti-sigma factor FlgM